MDNDKYTMLDKISLYIEYLSVKYNLVNIVIIIAIAYIIANIISVFKININF
mgnify:CR=1 FL=1